MAAANHDRTGSRLLVALVALVQVAALGAAEPIDAEQQRIDAVHRAWQERMLRERARLPEELRRVLRQTSVVPPLGEPAAPAGLHRFAVPPIGTLIPPFTLEVGAPTIGVSGGADAELLGRIGAGARIGFAYAVAEKQLAFTTSAEAKAVLRRHGSKADATTVVLPIWATRRSLIGPDALATDPSAGVEREISLKKAKLLFGYDAEGNLTVGGAFTPSPTNLVKSFEKWAKCEITVQIVASLPVRIVPATAAAPTAAASAASRAAVLVLAGPTTCPRCRGAGGFSCQTCQDRRTITCDRCQGRQQAACSRCGGGGDLICGSCHQTGITACGGCGGSGHARCGGCGGSGSVTVAQDEWEEYTEPVLVTSGTDENGLPITRVEHQTRTRLVTRHHSATCGTCSGSGDGGDCGTCGGDGRVTCHTCGGGGTVGCHACGADGLVGCSRCGADGLLTCPTCRGRAITCGLCRGAKTIGKR